MRSSEKRGKGNIHASLHQGIPHIGTEARFDLGVGPDPHLCPLRAIVAWVQLDDEDSG